MPNDEAVIGPQPGPQTMFLASRADIAIFGGAAFGGKSYGLLLDTLRHLDNPHFEAVTFRRNNKQVRNPGGLWDTSRQIYPYLNGIPHETYLKWNFPSGFTSRFDGLEYDSSVFDWQGSSIPWMGWDELTNFTEFQFFFLMGWNRSQAGTPGRIRATCNPDPDSFVRKLIDWWIGKDGYPIKKRSGVLRYFVRLNDELIFADSKEDIYKRCGRGPNILPKSLTFIAANLEDNKIGNEKDPTYRATLMNMTNVDRERLLRGNWNIRAQAGDYFRREWFEVVDEVPGGYIMVIRAWDRAATKPNPQNPNPDWTRGLLLYVYPDGTYCVGDLKSTQDTPGNVKKFMKQTAAMDGQNVRIRAYEDPGSAGKMEAEDLIRSFQGYDIECLRVSDKKHIRAKPVSSQAGNNQPAYGGIKVRRAEWNEAFFKELENFSEDDTLYDHDDIVDSLSLAYYFGKVNVANFSDEAVENFGALMQGFGRHR